MKDASKDSTDAYFRAIDASENSTDTSFSVKDASKDSIDSSFSAIDASEGSTNASTPGKAHQQIRQAQPFAGAALYVFFMFAFSGGISPL
ncbi:hypothetical protein [uncultured Acetobacteroides sp.]|uniref:hypothetical protein n=1 Tax=uncultured Acetobacteroides sp. TaxID=1760811 RepID=UPI0029F5775B|nr:hypothetical protein [uncultured Acetobacteroides sp.]